MIILQGLSNSYFFTHSENPQGMRSTGKNIPLLIKALTLTSIFGTALEAAKSPSLKVFDQYKWPFVISFGIATFAGVTNPENGLLVKGLDKTIQVAYVASAVALAILQPAYGCTALGMVAYSVMAKKQYIPRKVIHIVEKVSPILVLINCLCTAIMPLRILCLVGLIEKAIPLSLKYKWDAKIKNAGKTSDMRSLPTLQELHQNKTNYKINLSCEQIRNILDNPKQLSTNSMMFYRKYEESEFSQYDDYEKVLFQKLEGDKSKFIDRVSELQGRELPSIFGPLSKVERENFSFLSRLQLYLELAAAPRHAIHFFSDYEEMMLQNFGEMDQKSEQLIGEAEGSDLEKQQLFNRYNNAQDKRAFKQLILVSMGVLRVS